MRAHGVCKRFEQKRLFARKVSVVEALQDVDFEVAASSVTALVGESGSGKSTLARCLALMERPTNGEIWFEEADVSKLQRHELKWFRRAVQMVAQDASGSLNPRFTAAQIISEPLEVHGWEPGQELRSRVCELMNEVGLLSSWAKRRPFEFSGGQRQRLAIARALALQPSLLILDESLSGLDLSTQAQILNLLLELQERHRLTLLLISHDLSLVGQVADYVAVMEQGRIVEQGPRQEVFARPEHPHTRELLGTVRVIESGFRAAHAGAGR